MNPAGPGDVSRLVRGHWTLGHRLPGPIATRLFGDRKAFGLVIRPDDEDWLAWQRIYLTFYADTQKSGVGRIVNDAGYRILRRVDLADRRIFEAGPGSLPHLREWKGRPASYALLDNNPEMLARAASRLRGEGIDVACFDSGRSLGAINGTCDVAMAFYALEHLHPIDEYVGQILSVLKPGGLLVGAVPAEGGLAWGLGRFLTTRRYLKRHSTANPDKIVCWEHPNFAEGVLRALDRSFDRVRLEYWPLGVPAIDVNLVVKFIYRNRGRAS